MRLNRILSLALLAFTVAVPYAAAATPESYINGAFSYIAGEGGTPRLPMGEITAPDAPGTRFFKVRQAGGDVAYLYAFGPFAFADGSQVASVDTDLVATVGGWRAASVPFDVVIPSDLGDGILWRDAGRGDSVRIYPQNINSSPGRMYAGSTDTIIYDNVWNNAYMTVAVTPNGIKDHIILTQANGVPNQFKFRVERPAGARTTVTAGGAVQVVAADGTILAQLPAPAARDRDLQEFKIWYEVENRNDFDVIVLRYDTSPITAEGGAVTYEAPFDLDPAIYSGSLVHGVNAFRETSLNAYTVSDFNDGNLKASLLKVPTYEAGTFARWYITPPPEGSRWHSFSARAEGRVGVTQKYTLTDGAGERYAFGPAATAGTYFAQDISFTPQGDINSRIEATSASTPFHDYYGQLTNPVVIYEDLVDPILADLRPNGSTITDSNVTVRLGMRDAQSGCGTITVTLHGPAGPIGTRTSSGCTFTSSFNLRTEGPHRVEAVLTDRSGRETTASGSFTFDSPIDPPAPPVIDGDDPAVDQAWTNQTSTFSATWNSAPGAVSYQLCFTASAPCAAGDRWVGQAGRAGTIGGYGFQHGETVYACVRTVTSDGIRTTPTCSNGQRIDIVAPAAPSYVNDGEVAPDVDTSRSSLDAASNWSVVADESGAPVYFETCYKGMADACTDGHWALPEQPADNDETTSLQMNPGETNQACVRSLDQAGNRSQATCSDGFAVRAANSEIKSAVLDRANIGLPADREAVGRQIQSGAYNAYWAQSIPIVPSELDEVVVFTEFQTWLIDNEPILVALRNSGDIRLDVDPRTRTLSILVPQRACSPRVELQKALGQTYRAIRVPARQKPYVPISTQAARRIVDRLVMRDPQFANIELRAVNVKRKGVATRCITDMVAWFNRNDVRTRLENRDFSYDLAEVASSHQKVELTTPTKLRIYKSKDQSMRPRLIERVSPATTTTTSGDRCPDWGALGRNTFYCEQGNIQSGTIYHSEPRPDDEATPAYGGCTFGFPAYRATAGAIKLYMLTARHCHDQAKDINGIIQYFPNTAFTSWHATIGGRFAKLRTLIGHSDESLDSDIVDITAIETSTARPGAYMSPLPDSRTTPRALPVDVSSGVVKNSPVISTSTRLTIVSSRPSAEVNTTPEPNGIAKGYFEKNATQPKDPLAYAFVHNMKSCKGDSGSGMFVRTFRRGRFIYQPFAILSKNWVPGPASNFTREALYGWRSNRGQYPDPDKSIYQTYCGPSSLGAPAWGYMQRTGLTLRG